MKNLFAALRVLPAFAQKDAGKMSKLLAPLALVLALCPVAALARQGQQPTAARLVDSFGAIMMSDLMARLDNFAVELQNEPASSGVVVAYGAKHKFPGWPLRRAETAVDYLVKTRGLDSSRFSILNGELRDDVAFELWVVPLGAELNVKPFDVSLLMSGEKAPLLLDKFTVIERGGRIETEYSSDSYPTTVGLYTLPFAPSWCIIPAVFPVKIHFYETGAASHETPDSCVARALRAAAGNGAAADARREQALHLPLHD
jgi:hypothetical protein